MSGHSACRCACVFEYVCMHVCICFSPLQDGPTNVGLHVKGACKVIIRKYRIIDQHVTIIAYIYQVLAIAFVEIS